jgi:predicted PurR-regulated permease PerM
MENHEHNSANDSYIRKSLEVVVKVGLALGLIIWCFMILKPFLMITLWGIILTVAIYPLFSWLHRILGDRKKLAAILVTIFLVALILLPVILLGGSLFDALGKVKDALVNGRSIIPPPSEAVKTWPLIGNSLFDLWSKASNNLAGFTMDHKDKLMAVLSWFLSALSNAGLGFLMFLASIIISGIFLVYAEKGAEAARLIAVRLMGERGAVTVKKAEVTVRNVARGILGVAFIQAFLAGMGFLVAGVPGAGLWALISFVLAIVQIGIGPVVIGVLIYAFIKLSTLTAILLTAWCVPLLIIDNILKPLLLGKGAPVPMLVIFLGAIGGFISFGTIGLFVGAVILSLGYDLFLLWLKNEE